MAHGPLSLFSQPVGIGRGIATVLAKAGADVAIHYTKKRDEAEKSVALVREAGRKAVLVRGDFLKPAQIAAAMQEAVTGLGGSVDILVNNVGDLVGRVPFRSAQYLIFFPGLAIMISVVGFNLLGDGLRAIVVGLRHIAHSSAVGIPRHARHDEILVARNS